MLDQEEHSAETKTRGRRGVIKGRTLLDSGMGSGQKCRSGEPINGRDSKFEKQRRREKQLEARESSFFPFHFFS